jgi:hypothetical protein
MKRPDCFGMWLGIALLSASCTVTQVSYGCQDGGAVSIAIAPTPSMEPVTSNLVVGGSVFVGSEIVIESIDLGVSGVAIDGGGYWAGGYVVDASRLVEDISATVGADRRTWSATVPLTDLLGPSGGAPGLVTITATVNTNCSTPEMGAIATTEPFAVAPPPDAGTGVAPGDASGDGLQSPDGSLDGSAD